ncbi:hypothetical protein AX17_004960 [Amanita inopinata Kibby_2008]|nr:hypothetical protein AX17_004960 [Amanita inopinata Kibby_2008]
MKIQSTFGVRLNPLANPFSPISTKKLGVQDVIDSPKGSSTNATSTSDPNLNAISAIKPSTSSTPIPTRLRLGGMHNIRSEITTQSQWRRSCDEVRKRDSNVCAGCGCTFGQLVLPWGQIDTTSSFDLDCLGMDKDDAPQALDAVSNSDADTIRVFCPPCAHIQTLTGYVGKGYQGWLNLARSEMDQAEIVRRTRAYFEKIGNMPDVEEIDPAAVRSGISPYLFANWLKVKGEILKSEGKLHEELEREESLRSLKGFFTQTGSKLFWKKNNDSRSGTDDRIQIASRAAERALQCRPEDNPNSFQIITFDPVIHHDLERFLNDWQPSSVSRTQYKWIYVDNSFQEKPYTQPQYNSSALWNAWIQVCSKPTLTKGDIDALACEFGLLGGKWLLFVGTKRVDAIWRRIARAGYGGMLGPAVKVAPNQDSGMHVIEVLTENYLDEQDVFAVREALRKMGIYKKIVYKPDIYGRLSIHAGNAYGIQPSTYVS